jgi:hypothetical protein
MANNPPHSTAQWFSNCDITKTKTPDKAKDKTHSTTHKYEPPPPKKSDIHLHIPAHTQDHEPIQKQKHKDSIQMPQYHRQPYQTSKGPQHSTPQ